MADRRASADWRGDLFKGAGTVSAESSGLFRNADVTWASRTQETSGKTSPEELIAAAHAACFGMALSNELSSRGSDPKQLHVDATLSFEDGKVTTMALGVDADVPGLDEQGFKEALAAAEESCPVSNALRGNVEIKVTGGLG